MRTQRSISVVVPTRNQALLLENCLSSFLSQKSFPKEVVVVDNDSFDNTRKVVLSFSKKLPILYLFEKRISPAFARNRGISQARGEIITFLDHDCIADKGWVENIWRAHKRYKNSIVQGQWKNRLIKTNFSSNIYFFFIETYRNLLLTSRLERGNQVSFIDTKNCSLPRRILIEKKLKFDESFHWDEHIDFGLQALKKKVSIVYDPSIKVTHLTQKDIEGLIRLKIQTGEVGVALEKKWGLEKKRKQYLDRSNELVWQKNRKKLVSGIERQIYRKIAKNKNMLYSTLFLIAIEVLKLFQQISYQLNRQKVAKRNYYNRS